MGVARIDKVGGRGFALRVAQDAKRSSLKRCWQVPSASCRQEGAFGVWVPKMWSWTLTRHNGLTSWNPMCQQREEPVKDATHEVQGWSA